MEKQGSLRAAGGLNRESPRGAIRGMLGGIRGVEEVARLPSGVVLSHSSGRPGHSGGIVICSPGSSRPSGVAAVHGSPAPTSVLGRLRSTVLGPARTMAGLIPHFLKPVYPGRPALDARGLGCTTQDAVCSPGQLVCTPTNPMRIGSGVS